MLNVFAAIFNQSLAGAPLNFFVTVIVFLQCYIEKQNNLQLLLLAKRLGRKKKRSYWVKKGRTSKQRNKCIINQVPESDWQENVR